MENSTNPFSALRAKHKVDSIISKFQQLADDSTIDMANLKQSCKELASTLSALNWDMQLQQQNHFSYFTGWKVQFVEPFNPQGSPEQRFIDGPYLVVIEVEVFNDGYDKQVVHYMKEVDVRYDFIAHELKLNLSLRENEKIVMWARQDELIENLKGLF